MDNSSDNNNTGDNFHNHKKTSVSTKKNVATRSLTNCGDEIILEISDKLAQAKSKKSQISLKKLEIRDDLKDLATEIQFLGKSFLQVKDFLNNKFNFELKTKINQCVKELRLTSKNDSDSINIVLNACRKAGKDARDQKCYDVAIDILSELDKSVLPAISTSLPQTKINSIKYSVLKELEQVYLEKGKIEEAIKIVEKRSQEPLIEPSQFIKSQLDKTQLLMKKGEFNKALDVLNRTLKFQKDKNLDLKYSIEIKRVLGTVYRGKGDYDKALNWFSAAELESKELGDNEFYGNIKWGKGILFYLKGDFDEAIKIWEELISYYKSICSKERKDSKKLISNYISLQFEYIRTLELSGKFTEAEKFLYKTLRMIDEYPDLKDYKMKVHLLFSEFYYLTGNIEEATTSIEKVKILNETVKATNNSYALSELMILKSEIDILLALDKSLEAKERLLPELENCKSNWDLFLYYKLIAKIEKHDMNFGLAKKAYLSALDIIKEIGAFSLSDELFYFSLLIDMAKSGNKKAWQEAETYLQYLDKKIVQEKLPAIKLEFQLLKSQLACVNTNYDEAYQILSETYKEADEKHYLRQKKKIIEALNALEQQGKGFDAITKEVSVLRYLEDARRTLENYLQL